jgi:uncharacterized protein RhaS with RHS repeats
LQWNINRWYDSNVGRWVSEDPIGFREKDLNLYRYSKNIVSTFIDIAGLATSTPTYFCCNMASGFEQNFVLWGMGDPWTCVRNMFSDVWWFDPI